MRPPDHTRLARPSGFLVAAIVALSAVASATARPLDPPPGKKVTICHRTHSTSHPFVTLTVTIHAVAAHLRNHLDSLGPCPVPGGAPVNGTTAGNGNAQGKASGAGSSAGGAGDGGAKDHGDNSTPASGNGPADPAAGGHGSDTGDAGTPGAGNGDHSPNGNPGNGNGGSNGNGKHP